MLLTIGIYISWKHNIQHFVVHYTSTLPVYFLNILWSKGTVLLYCLQWSRNSDKQTATALHASSIWTTKCYHKPPLFDCIPLTWSDTHFNNVCSRKKKFFYHFSCHHVACLDRRNNITYIGNCKASAAKTNCGNRVLSRSFTS